MKSLPNLTPWLVPPRSGLFFLLNNTTNPPEVVYVGKTLDHLRSISEAYHRHPSEWNEVRFLALPPSQLNSERAFYIHQFQPRLNIRQTLAAVTKKPKSFRRERPL